jgi:hypothetical protein
MTPTELRTIINRYRKAHSLSSFTKAAEGVAREIGMQPGAFGRF